MELKDILTLLFSLGALIFSFFNFKRGKKFENENHLFKSKLEVYSKILTELQYLINILQDNIDEAKETLKHQNKENLDILDKQADEVDDACFAFNDFIVSNSLVIPKTVLKFLDKFCDKILDTETIDSQTKNTKDDIAEIEKIIDELVEEADKISDLLRRDIRIEELNSSLYRRLK